MFFHVFEPDLETAHLTLGLLLHRHRKRNTRSPDLCFRLSLLETPSLGPHLVHPCTVDAHIRPEPEQGPVPVTCDALHVSSKNPLFLGVYDWVYDDPTP